MISLPITYRNSNIARLLFKTLGDCWVLCFLCFFSPEALAQVQPTISTATSSVSNSYTTPQTVTISTSSGSLYMTTDGSQPTNASPAYTAPFVVSTPTVVKAVSYLAGSYSAVTTMYLDVDPALDQIVVPGLALRLRADFGVVTAAGSPPPVTTWTDLSGNGNDATGTSSTEPKLITDVVNSFPAVSVNGSSEYLSLPTGFADFTKALISISNAPPYATSTQRIKVNGNNADYSANTSATNATVATGLASAINALAISGVSATASGSVITITAPATTVLEGVPAQGVGIQIQNAGATLFVVGRPAALTANACILDLSQGASGNNIKMQISATGSKGQFSVFSSTTGSDAQSSGALSSSYFQTLSAVLTPGTSNASAIFFVNGIAGPPNTGMYNIPNVSRNNNFIGKGYGGNYFSGKLCEVLLYTTRLSSTQISAVTAQLIQKYQLLSQTAAAPIISVPGSVLLQPSQVTISSQPGTQTYLTFDNSTPSSSSELYDGKPIKINYSQTIKAISYLNGVASPISSATYVLDASQWPAPNPTDFTAPTINLELPAPSI